MLEYEDLEHVKKLNCQNKDAKHMFHLDCLIMWFYKKPLCPICVTEFEDQIKKVIKKSPA